VDRLAFLDRAQGIHAALARHVDVQQYDVTHSLAREVHGLTAGNGF